MYPLPLFASRLLQRPLGIKISQQILSKRFSKALLNHWRTLSMNYVQIKLLYNMAASIKPSWKLLSPAATQQCFDWSWDYLPWLSWRQVVGRSYRVPSWLYFCGRNQQRWWSWPGACHGGHGGHEGLAMGWVGEEVCQVSPLWWARTHPSVLGHLTMVLAGSLSQLKWCDSLKASCWSKRQ